MTAYSFRLTYRLCVFLLIVSSLLVNYDRPAQAQSPKVAIPGMCDAACTTDSDCQNNVFCHSTIDWGNWQDQTSILNQIGSGQITGWNTYSRPDGNSRYHLVKGGKVFTNSGTGNGWDSGNDFTICNDGTPGQCGFPEVSKAEGTISNPVVGFNSFVRTDNGVQVLVQHLVRYRELYDRKTNYLTGEVIAPWTRSTALDSLLTTHGGSWNQWAFLSFDSNIAYEDGRQQQQLVIGRVDDRDTPSIDDDRIFETKLLVRIQKRNNEGNYVWAPWYLAAITHNNLDSHGLGGPSAQGSLVSYDSSYTSHTQTYIDTIVRWYWNGSAYVPQVWQREAVKRSTTQKVCRPIVFPQSCTMPAYIPPEPTNTPYRPPTSDIPVAENLSATVACTQGQATFSWTMPANQQNYEIGMAKFEYCLKNSSNQNTCTNPQGDQVANLFLELSSATKYARNKALSDFGLAKGQTALVRLRLSPEEVPNGASGIVYGDASNYITVDYSGPEGDYNDDCGVNVTDYTSVVTQLFDEVDHIWHNNGALFLLNKLIRNFGTSN